MIIKTVLPEMAQDIINFVKATSAETANLITTPDEFNITLEQEIKHIQNQIDSRLSNMIIAMIDNEIVGLCGLHGRDGRVRISHISSLGITVSKKHWGKGVGLALMKAQIEYCKKHKIAKINLEVRTDNIPAVNLYKKCGFVIEGTNRRSMLINDVYVDTFYMGLLV